MKTTRVRTESMVERYSKKPVSEGFDLWDRDYPFGAIHLFIFKSETALPFQLGPCLDAIAEISLRMNGLEDAQNYFAVAADKYQLVQQPILAELMRVKACEVQHGTVTALAQLQQFLQEKDPKRNGGGNEAEIKTRSSLARCYAYLAELLLNSCEDQDTTTVAPRAVEAAQLAVELGWDRVHTGYYTLGDAHEAAGDLSKAKDAYDNALHHCPHYLDALERQIDVVKRLGGGAKALTPLINQAIQAHPRASLLREKAFLMSEAEGDTAALAFLDTYIATPPLEETQSVDNVGGETVATLRKAKAAILADAGKFAEALAEAQHAVAANPKDEEAASIVTDIKASM